MNRREKARQHKRKERERRLRQQRHAAQAHPDSAEAFEPEFEPEPLDAPAEDTPDDTPADAAPALTPLLAPFESERRQRRIARALAARAFPDAASRERAAAELAAQTPNALDAAFGPDPIEAAHDLALIAWDTEDPEEADGYLDEALELDPACVHARTLDALIENRGDRLITALAGIVEDAARALGGELFLARVKGRIWDEVRAWPYLTARNTLVEALIEAGRADEAIVHGEALLELDPDDHLNVRNHVCGALLERDELARARALLDRYAAVGGLGLAWGLILERFLSGARREAAALHRPTRRVLPEVEDLILGTARPVAPRDPAATVIEKLAADIHAPMARAWARHREARRWLADGALASTAAERRAVADSYRPPVAALLRLGEPTFGGPGEDLRAWPDHAARLGLTAAHVPDLLRMAADPALHEQDPGKPAVWAPVHAWRTLALMAARGVPGAAEVHVVLTTRLVTAPEDDWTYDDAVNVLALVGEPAFADVADVLRERTYATDVRMAVADALAGMVGRHPHVRERVVEALLTVIRDALNDAETLRKEGASDEEIVQDVETEVVGMAVSGLMRVKAGAGGRGSEVVGVVQRAFEAGIVEVRMSGVWDEVRTKMLGDGQD